MRRVSKLRFGFSLIEVLVVIAILSLLIGLTLAAVQRVRSSSTRVSCQNNLRQIGLGLSHYQAANGYFPCGVTVKDSAFEYMNWHARILPYIERDDLWRQTEAAYKVSPQWGDAPHPIAVVVPTFYCPADSRTFQANFTRKRLFVANTSYLGVAGTRNLRRDGVLFYDSQIKVAEITDGTSQTLLVGERPPSKDYWQGWWYAGVGIDFKGTADGVMGVKETAGSAVDPMVDGCEQAGFQADSIDNRCSVFHFWSLHSGGANFLFADGSVRLIRYEAEPLLAALATRAGGESEQLSD